MRSLGVSFDLRRAFMRDGRPTPCSSLLVETMDLPAERRHIIYRSDIAVQANFELFFLVLCNGGRRAHHVAPHNRTGVSESRNRSGPANPLAFGDVPAFWKGKSFGDAICVDPTELRPVDAGSRALLSRRRHTHRAHERTRRERRDVLSGTSHVFTPHALSTDGRFLPCCVACSNACA